jgi:hypothetical protein
MRRCMSLMGSILRVPPAGCHGRSPSDSCRNYPRAAIHPPCHRRKSVGAVWSYLSSHAGALRTYSNAKTRFQSFFMSTTVHLFSAAASRALSSFPKCDWRS